MKVETDIITSITVKPLKQAPILVIMCIKTFKTAVLFLSVTHIQSNLY